MLEPACGPAVRLGPRIEVKAPSWRNEKYRVDVWNGLKTYIFPKIGRLPVAAVDTSHVLSCLKPIWSKIPVTASKIGQRVAGIIDYAMAKRYIPPGPNPAAWKGHLEHLLTTTAVIKVEHHEALPWRDVPAFMAKLRQRRRCHTSEFSD